MTRGCGQRPLPDRRTESGCRSDRDVSSGTPGRRAVDRAGLHGAIAARLSELIGRDVLMAKEWRQVALCPVTWCAGERPL